MEKQKTFQPLEIWGGIECTVNRVRDQYMDQLVDNGHQYRIEDLDMIASLGINTLRYPVLWERVAPDSLENPDWEWTDERLNRLQQLGIKPIAGLLHHGSGPRYTDLTDPDFASKLATYAGMVAARYPWLTLYTPVNEPLTTARFSGLYGFWYPHGRDGLTFVKCLLNECKGTVLAMKAIRQVQPEAKLIQTEDLGQTASTPLLAYQAEFENTRRWLSLDLLCGKVTPEHPMWGYMTRLGIKEEELAFFLKNPCSPDIIGINYYLTSERYLDEALEKYPEQLHGGNGRHAYADTEAVRVCDVPMAGPEDLLMQVWNRYQIRTAVTEVHLGCTREDQIRWFNYVWNEARQAKEKGADICAVTAWSMLGSTDWDSLLTLKRNHYEPGVFDVRAPQPRPTAIAHLVKELSNGYSGHPLLQQPGWWQREDRWLYALNKPASQDSSAGKYRPVIITGATGTLGHAFARICKQRGIAYALLCRAEMDITNPKQIKDVIEKLNPWAIINTAGYVRVDQAETEPDLCFHENTLGASTLASICHKYGIQLVTFSSDLVFDGRKGSPYVETDAVNPKSVYGASKAAAEREVLELMPEALIIRTSAFFGPWDEYNFITMLLRAFQAGQPFDASAHHFISPTYVPDLVNSSLDLLIDKATGVWHLANKGVMSWADLGREAALRAGIDIKLVRKWYRKQLRAAIGKALISNILGSCKIQSMPELSNALDRYFQACEHLPKAVPATMLTSSASS
jgi:dTDP-4-dehydrorhamnose reductase